MRDYARQGFKVGPDYCPPVAATAPTWIDEADVRVRTNSEVPGQWWTLLNDATLNGLIESAASQNLSLREACFRILEARAQLAIAKGAFFPQLQNASGAYNRVVTPGSELSTANFPPLPPPLPPWPPTLSFPASFADRWDFGFNLAWELDLWGRLRRAIASADATLDASVADYDDVLVTLLADVASTYAEVRTLQKRIELLGANADLQRRIVKIAQRRFEEGQRDELDVAQAASILEQTESQIPRLRVSLRGACNRLCVLVGSPPFDLERQIGESPIPTVPEDIVVGIPADLLLRRPDVRRAERLAAAQAEQIGIAESDLYPIFAINGALGWEAGTLPKLFTSNSLNSHVGPAFQWNLLHYGRIRNNVRLQEAEFQRLAAQYQNTVLAAGAEVESALARFLQAQESAKLLDRSVAHAQKAVAIISRKQEEGAVDFNRVALIAQTLVQQQDLQAQAHGEIVEGLIRVYRALGGGWETPIPQPATNEAQP
jgi:NodT family efflux transporter outer membrane factor (OMF) lipoprotein